MTTKPPSTVQSASEESLEHVAYSAVEGIPTVEPHDLDRLGYSIWLWMKYRRDPLHLAVKTAGSRLLISEEEAVDRIRAKLKAKGITL